MGELKPCPFCGGEAQQIMVRDGRQVFCGSCRASGPPAYHGTTSMRSALKRADDAWNTRALPSQEDAGLREALTPSAETKAAYMGEFRVPLPDRDEEGNEVMRHINVPWTTIKEIMAAIRARAALAKGGSEK